MIGRLPEANANDRRKSSKHAVSDAVVKDLLRWLVSRQTLYLHEEKQEEDSIHPTTTDDVHSFEKKGAHLIERADRDEVASIEPSTEQMQWGGFNGRCNKVADTCYAFWVGASLAVSHDPQFLLGESRLSFSRCCIMSLYKISVLPKDISCRRHNMLLGVSANCAAISQVMQSRSRCSRTATIDI